MLHPEATDEVKTIGKTFVDDFFAQTNCPSSKLNLYLDLLTNMVDSSQDANDSLLIHVYFLEMLLSQKKLNVQLNVAFCYFNKLLGKYADNEEVKDRIALLMENPLL